MKKYVKYSHKFSFYNLVLYIITTGTYFGEFLILNLKSTTGKLLIVSVTYPFDLDSWPLFIALVIMQSVLFSCWNFANFTSESLLAALVSFIKLQEKSRN